MYGVACGHELSNVSQDFLEVRKKCAGRRNRCAAAVRQAPNVQSGPMLRELLRALALAMLVLAVQVQGFAAVSGGMCMDLGHHGDADAQHDHGAAAWQQHDHDAGADHHHDGDGSDGKHGDHCAPCVACGATVAIAAFPPYVMPDRTVSPLHPAPLASFKGIGPERLERPPLAS